MHAGGQRHNLLIRMPKFITVACLALSLAAPWGTVFASDTSPATLLKNLINLRKSFSPQTGD